jgi:UDP-GlcNAc:undecaprenyl-phosphate/decaprenyl-phosphate GlcNAc-1-phosphate transferase
MNNLLLMHIILLFAGAFLFNYYMIPKIRSVLRYKLIMEKPNGRSSHKMPTPSLGGIAIYLAIMISFYFTHKFDYNNLTFAIIPGLSVLFVGGLKDDLVVLGPFAKLFIQVIAAVFLAWHLQFRLYDLHGFMGIENIPPWLSILISVLIITSVINCINLIDGIDGLAATLSIIMFSVFGALFYMAGIVFLMLNCIIMVGSLLAFLRFNLSKTKKIFMGDTGAFVVGFMLGVMAVSFLALDNPTLEKLPFLPENLAYVVAAVLCIPLYDSIRVFFVRIIKKHNPFSGDRNHIHHIIIDTFAISHRRASFFIGIFTFLIIIIFVFLAMRESQWYLFSIFILLIFVFTLFFYLLSKRRKRYNRENNKNTR